MARGGGPDRGLGQRTFDAREPAAQRGTLVTGNDLFLVTGATGKTGAHVVRLLRAEGLRVRALVHGIDERSAALTELGADVVTGDLRAFDDVSSAMAGVTAAYFCYPIDPDGLLDATAVFAQAATEAGVRAV